MPDGTQNRHSRTGELRKVTENSHRHSSSRIYYARTRHGGKEIVRSLHTRDLAKRRLKDELAKVEKVDLKLAKMSLEELLKLYEARLSQCAGKTAATRHSILKIFKRTWSYGLAMPVREISLGQLELWLGQRRANMRNSTFNKYARFIRHVFDLAVKLRVLAESPALGIKPLPVRRSRDGAESGKTGSGRISQRVCW